jgi:uncharacterized protein (DUF433 family)
MGLRERAPDSALGVTTDVESRNINVKEAETMTIPTELQTVLSSDPNIMGGDICFKGTRIPVVMLLDNVVAGTSWDDFYDAYPDLTPEIVQPVLEWESKQAKKAMGL